MARRQTPPASPKPPAAWFRDRIVELRRVPPSQLEAHPKNWRKHGPDQQAAMQGLLGTLGFVDALLVRELGPEHYQVLDGHMRKDLAEGAPEVPVLVLDVTDEEADLVLATFDPIGDLAIPDEETADALAQAVWTENEAINTVLRDLLTQHPDVPDEQAPDGGSWETHPLAPQAYEHYDYVVILSRHLLDFERLCQVLDIAPKADFSVPGSAKKIGLGRCLDAGKFLRLWEARV